MWRRRKKVDAIARNKNTWWAASISPLGCGAVLFKIVSIADALRNKAERIKPILRVFSTPLLNAISVYKSKTGVMVIWAMSTSWFSIIASAIGRLLHFHVTAFAAASSVSVFCEACARPAF